MANPVSSIFPSVPEQVVGLKVLAPVMLGVVETVTTNAALAPSQPAEVVCET